MDCSNYFVCTACKEPVVDELLTDEEIEASRCSLSNTKLIRNLFSFFIFGQVNNFAYVVFLTGATKILGKDYPTSTVLLAEMLPILFAQAVAPMFIEYIPFWIRIIFLSVSATGAFLLMATFDENQIVSLLGIVIASLSSGFGEPTYMALSSYYHKNTVSAYSSGTGGAGVSGAFLFLVLSSIAKLQTKTILYICSPVPLLMMLFYFFVLTERDNHSFGSPELVTNGVDEKDSTDYDADTYSPEIPFIAQRKDEEEEEKLTLANKFYLQIRLFRYTGPLFVVYFAEYMINQGLFPACTFPLNDYFSRQEYVYYQFLYQIGVFISRSSVNLIQIKSLWFLSTWQVINMIIFWTTAYYNYVPSIYIIFALVLYEGLIGGAVYVNAFYLVREEIKGSIKEFCMSSISVWYSCGILASGVAALFVQPWLQGRREESYFIDLYNYTNATGSPTTAFM